ncbi:MAG: DNA repair exonuclease [Crenarchaeota archaeon]|nr:DNA repair exonuclease [Thermoproteota archaeon]
MLIAHLADVHIGHRQYGLDKRAEDYAKAFAKAVDLILRLKEEKDVDLVVICGDLFDSAKPGPLAYINAIDCLRKLREAGLRVVVIRGNHEASVINPSENPLSVLSSMGLIEYFERKSYMIGDINFVCYGCVYTEHQNKLYAYILNSLREDKPNVVLIHQYVEGTPYLYPMPNIDYYAISSKIVESAMDGRDVLFLCGHIHDFDLRHPTLPVFYPGSLEIWDSREFETYVMENEKIVKTRDMASKGFLLFDISESSGKYRVIPYRIEPSRKMTKIVLKYDELDPAKLRRDIVYLIERFDVPDAYLQIEIKGRLARGYSVRDLQCSQFRRMFRNVLRVDFRIDIERPSSSSVKTCHKSLSGEYYGIDIIIKRAVREVLKNDPDVSKIENIVLELLDLAERGEKANVVKIFERVLGVQLRQDSDIRSLLF